MQTIIEPTPKATAQLAQRPIEQVAEELAAELMELNILPAQVTQPISVV
jgi:hypothetical protein